MSKSLILLIEDDPDIASANKIMLELEGYSVIEARTLKKGKELVESVSPDLVVMDIMLPDGNSLEYCRELRGKSGVRILFLSALGTKEDIVKGLRAGGDDYLAKPYIMDELILRIQSLMRRGNMNQSDTNKGRLTFNSLSNQAFCDGEDLMLKPKEYAVLELLDQNRDFYLSAEEIYSAVWNAEGGDDLGTVHNHIYSLRKKLSGKGFIIELKRGRGYRLKET